VPRAAARLLALDQEAPTSLSLLFVQDQEVLVPRHLKEERERVVERVGGDRRNHSIIIMMIVMVPPC
jgi:hypothetical protein